MQLTLHNRAIYRILCNSSCSMSCCTLGIWSKPCARLCPGISAPPQDRQSWYTWHISLNPWFRSKIPLQRSVKKELTPNCQNLKDGWFPFRKKNLHSNPILKLKFWLDFEIIYLVYDIFCTRNFTKRPSKNLHLLQLTKFLCWKHLKTALPDVQRLNSSLKTLKTPSTTTKSPRQIQK